MAVGGLNVRDPQRGCVARCATIAAYGFDLAVELLAAQKGFAVALATTLTLGKTA